MSVPQTIRELVERFERQLDAYRSPQYNETQLRREFLDPFFKALGWDIDDEQGYAEAYKDVIDFKAEKGRHEAPDELTLGLDLDDKLLRDILKSLYYPESPYVFSALRADILGQVYEQFLGKVIRLTEGHRAVVEEKPEVKKAGGVFYTPTYIVEYIVENTVGKLLDEAMGSARAPRPAVGALADGSVSAAAVGLREGAQTNARGGRAPLDARRAS